MFEKKFSWFCSTVVMSAVFVLILNNVNATLNIKHCLSISGVVFLLNELKIMFNLHWCSNHNENIIRHICNGSLSVYQEQLTRRIQKYQSIRNSPTRETSLLKQFALQKFPSPWHKKVSENFLAGPIFKIKGTWYAGGSLVSHDVRSDFPGLHQVKVSKKKIQPFRPAPPFVKLGTVGLFLVYYHLMKARWTKLKRRGKTKRQLVPR